MYDDVYEDEETRVIEPRAEREAPPPEPPRPRTPPRPGETRPFWLTSELWAIVALVAAAAIAAATSDAVDARVFWGVAAVAVAAYVVSRGFAKSDTAASTWDPRERMLERLRSRRDVSGP